MVLRGSIAHDSKSNVVNRASVGLLSNDDSRDDSIINPPRQNGSGFVSRLGKFSTAVLAASFVIYLACLVFLTFLWAANTNNTIWRKIVVDGWMTRSVTISSLVLRSTATTQAILATSMLAAVLIQTYAVPLPSAAAVSIMRFDNTGPWSLLNRMRTDRYYGSVWIALPTLLLSITTLALQFTSTALLSQLSEVTSNLGTTLKEFPTFAEWAANVTVPGKAEFAANLRPGVQDTGTVVRAFLPIDGANNRSRVMEYQGKATAVDMRVVCSAPKLTDVVYSTYTGYTITGLADIVENSTGLRQQLDADGSSNFTMSFECPFAATGTGGHEVSTPTSWPLALCRPIYWHSKKGISSVMDSKGKEVGISYLLINATMKEAVTTFDGSDVWTSISLTANDSANFRADLQVTLCMTAFEAQEMNIHATRSAPIPPEPALTWDTVATTYNTSAVQRQLGGGTTYRSARLSTAERGIFELATQSWGWVTRPQYIDLTGGFFSTTSAADAIGVSGHYYRGYMNEAQYSIFAQMAAATSSPALALQAFFTNLFAITYYDRIVMFDSALPSSQISLIQVIRPLGWTAYVVVVSVAVLHLLLIVLVTFTFWRAGELSRIGNAWTAVSQILGPIIEDWIKDADRVHDKTVRMWLKTRGLDRTLVHVGDDQGRVQLVRKDKVS